MIAVRELINSTEPFNPPQNDEELIARTRSGDREAFDQVVRRHRSKLAVAGHALNVRLTNRWDKLCKAITNGETLV